MSACDSWGTLPLLCGSEGVRSGRGAYEAGAPASLTEGVQEVEHSVPGEGMCASGSHSRVGDVCVCMCEAE